MMGVDRLSRAALSMGSRSSNTFLLVLCSNRLTGMWSSVS